MRFSWKVTVFIVLLALGVVGVAVLYVTKDSVLALGVRLGIHAYNTRFNSTLTIQDVSLDLFTRTATVRGLSITPRGHTSLESPLQINQATGNIRLWPLFKRQLVLENIRVSEAIVRYAIDADHRTNFEEMFRPLQDENSAEPSHWNVIIRRFELQQGMANVVIEGQPLHAALSGVAIQGSFMLEPTHFQAELTNGHGEVTYGMGQDVLRYHLVEITAALNLLENRLTIERFRVKAKEFTFSGQGVLEDSRIAAKFEADVSVASLSSLSPTPLPSVGTVAIKGSLAGPVNSPDVHLTAHGERVGVGPYTISSLSASLALAQARLQIDRFAIGFLGGTIQAKGALELGELHLSQPRIDMQVQVDNLPVADLLPLAGITTPLLDGIVAGRISIVSPSFDLSLMRVEGAISLSQPARETPTASQPFPLPVSLTSTLRFADRTLVFESVSWALNGAKGEMSGTLRLDGAVNVKGTLQADLGAQTFARFHLPLVQGEAKLKFNVRGNIDAPQLEADLNVRNARYHNIHLDSFQMVFEVERSDVKIRSLRGTQGTMHFQLAAGVKLSAPFTRLDLSSTAFPIQAVTGLQLQIERLNLAMVAPLLPVPLPLAGELTLEARADGPWSRLKGESQIAIRGLLVRGEKVGDIAMLVEGSPTHVTLKRFSAELGGGQVQAKGALTLPDQIDMTLEWKGVRLEHLGFFEGITIPAAGAIDGTVWARGVWPELTAEVSVRGHRLTAHGIDIADLQLQGIASPRELRLLQLTTRVAGARLTAAGHVAWNGPLEIRLSSEDIPLQGFRLPSRGFPVVGRAKVDLKGSGTLANPTLRGQVQLTGVRAGGMTLGTGAVAFSLDGQRVTFATTGLEGVSLNGGITLDSMLPVQVHLAVRSLDLGLVTAHLGSGTAKGLIEGDVSGTVEVNGQLRSLQTLVGSIVVEHLHLRSNGVEMRNVAPLRWLLQKGLLVFEAVRLRGQGVNLDLGGSINLLEGRFDVALTGTGPLAIIGARMPGLRFQQGVVETDLNLRGQFAQPTVEGHLLLRDGVIHIPGINESLSQLKAEIRFAGQTIAIESLDGKLASGDVKVSGELQLEGFQLHQMRFTAQANQVRLRYPTDFFALLNAEVIITGNSEAQQVQGEVSLTRSRYRQEVDIATLILNYRQRRLEPPPLERENPTFDIRVYTTDPLRVDNRLAKADLMVDLSVRGSLNRPVVLGRVDIEKGTAEVAGNRFTVDFGSVDFLNPTRTEAFFDIAANTQKSGYRIHVTATGTPQQFDLHFTSEPALGEVDILALLMAGATGQVLTTGVRAILPGQVSSFLTGQLAEEVRRGVGMFVGVDRVDIEPVVGGAQRVGGPKVTVGKDLSKNLSVNYSTILGSTREDLVSVEFRITDRISVLGVRDERGDIGVDLKFSFRFE